MIVHLNIFVLGLVLTEACAHVIAADQYPHEDHGHDTLHNMQLWKESYLDFHAIYGIRLLGVLAWSPSVRAKP